MLKKKLYAVDLSETFPYRPFGADDETVFTLGALDGLIRARIDDEQTQYGLSADQSPDTRADMTINRHQRNIEIVRYGVKGWINFKTAKGQEIVFDTVANAKYGRSRNVLSDECLRVMPTELIDDLAEQILSLNTLKEQDVKN